MLLHIIHWLYPFFRGVAFGILAMTLHEFGHIAAALLLGVRVKYVGLRWKGIYTVREAGPPLKNLLVSFAGPATNLLLLLTTPHTHIFALANFSMALGNLLPIRGSDGNRMLCCWRELKNEKSGSDKNDSCCRS